VLSDAHPEFPRIATATAAPREIYAMKLTRRLRAAIYVICAGVWLTGVLWLVFHYFLRTEGPFGFRNNPLEVWCLKAHGAFSFASLWLLGRLWAVHVMRGWNMRWRRWSGGSLVGAVFVLILSAYGLYYVDGKAWRDWTGILHWIIGILALAIFFIHRMSKAAPTHKEAAHSRILPRRPYRPARRG
jgi:hypothetical protein